MMQECPKCGFIQPQDRYCAYCGLDIEHFHRQSPPWYQRIVTHSGFQVGLILIAIGTGVGYIYWQQKREFPSQTAVLDPSPSQNGTSSSKVSSAKNKTAGVHSPNPPPPTSPLGTQRTPSSTRESEYGAHGEQADRANNQAPERRENKINSTQSSLSAGNQRETTQPLDEKDRRRPEGSETSTPIATRLVLRWAEASRHWLDQLLSQSQVLQEHSHLQVFSYPTQESLEQIFQKNSKEVVPGKALERAIQGEPLRLMMPPTTYDNTDEREGLSLAVQVSSINPLGMVIDTEGEIFIKGDSASTGGSPTTSHNSLAGSYTLGTGAILVITGFVPRIKLNENQLSLFRNTPLLIMNSADFQSGETELAIFLQAR